MRLYPIAEGFENDRADIGSVIGLMISTIFGPMFIDTKLAIRDCRDVNMMPGARCGFKRIIFSTDDCKYAW